MPADQTPASAVPLVPPPERTDCRDIREEAPCSGSVLRDRQGALSGCGPADPQGRSSLRSSTWWRPRPQRVSRGSCMFFACASSGSAIAGTAGIEMGFCLISGSAMWHGIVVGGDFGRNEAFQGDAEAGGVFEIDGGTGLVLLIRTSRPLPPEKCLRPLSSGHQRMSPAGERGHVSQFPSCHRPA